MCGKLLMPLQRRGNQICVLLFFVMLPIQVVAAPWDEDLYKQQSYKANEMARAPALGSVAVGQKPFTMTVDEAEAKLENPVPFGLDSVWRGKRLWNANCLTCHGKTAKGDGPVGPKMSVPSLLDDIYKTRKDGRYFAVIRLGGSSMPRYGYKLSILEQWDLINYLRFLQGKNVEGMTRPNE